MYGLWGFLRKGEGVMLTVLFIFTVVAKAAILTAALIMMVAIVGVGLCMMVGVFNEHDDED